jgi:hypothetical protein
VTKYDKLAYKYYGYLHHFLEEGAWPCYIPEKNLKKTICRDIPALSINKSGRLCRDVSHDFDDRLVSAFYKLCYKRTQSDLWQLSKKLHKLADEY